MIDESSGKCEGILRYVKSVTSNDEISEGNKLRAAVIFTLVTLALSFILCLFRTIKCCHQLMSLIM